MARRDAIIQSRRVLRRAEGVRAEGISGDTRESGRDCPPPNRGRSDALPADHVLGVVRCDSPIRGAESGAGGLLSRGQAVPPRIRADRHPLRRTDVARRIAIGAPTGRTLGRLGDRGVLEPRARANRHHVPDDARGDSRSLLDHAAAGDHAVEDLRGSSDHAPLEDDAVANDRVPLDPRGFVEAGVVHHAPGSEDGIRPDVAGTTDRDPFVDPRGRIEDHGSLALHAGAAERLSLPPDDLHAGFPEVVWTPDVHPHAIDPGSVQRQAFGEELREQVLREVELLVHRDELEDLRLEDVDARVREVREGLLLPRLLLELLDAALRVETDDPELGRVLDVGQGDRHDAAFPLVEIVQRLEVDVAQNVAHRDEERVVDEHADPAHGARGARRVLLEAVHDRRVVVEAVADRFDQGVRQVRGRHDNLVEPGPCEGAQHVIDARPSRDRDERLRSLVRQRFQARAFAAREDDRLHRPISTFPFSNNALRAASAEASSFLSSRRASRTARFCWRNRVRASRASERFAPLIERTFSRISTTFAWTSSALPRAARNDSCFSFPSRTSAAIWWTIPRVSSCTARAFSLSPTAASCSFPAAPKNSVMPESMSLISFAILSCSALSPSSCLRRFIDSLSSPSSSFSAPSVKDAVCCRISIAATRRFKPRNSAPTSAWPEPRSFRFISIRAFAFAWSSSRFSRCLRASPANEARRSLSPRSFAPISRFVSWTRSRSWRRSAASWFKASRFSRRLWSLISA